MFCRGFEHAGTNPGRNGGPKGRLKKLLTTKTLGKITNNKFQMTNKFQLQNTKINLLTLLKIGFCELFEI